ncbi:LANO_0F04280g1_1 [Lachancea nothofagi CBS 11611]|uniref:LANO_0F04280g1_1 n=1 Tax=Lachancea nothofagi CBS 11611 TaxID=1266666 RepID=A0A1G4K7L1_9SACH|nr:LANO_0F04280g1_1 [Lachancea nothofagi CBS 11611]
MDREAEKQELHNQFVAELREQDRWLPINNVGRLMKSTLPTSAKVSKDAKECMQECVSEFISFVTSEANDRCTQDKRKTINGEDILISLNALGFENYAEVLKIYLAKYRQQQALKNQMTYMRRDGLSEDLDSAPHDEGRVSTPTNLEHDASQRDLSDSAEAEEELQTTAGSSRNNEGDYIQEDTQLYL